MIGIEIVILVCSGCVWVILRAIWCWARYIAKNCDISDSLTHELVVTWDDFTFSLNIYTILYLIKLILFVLIFFFFLYIIIIINIWVLIIIFFFFFFFFRVLLSFIVLLRLFDICLLFYRRLLLTIAKWSLYFRLVSDNAARFSCVGWMWCRFRLELIRLVSISIFLVVIIEISALFIKHVI